MVPPQFGIFYALFGVGRLAKGGEDHGENQSQHQQRRPAQTPSRSPKREAAGDLKTIKAIRQVTTFCTPKSRLAHP